VIVILDYANSPKVDTADIKNSREIIQKQRWTALKVDTLGKKSYRLGCNSK